MYLDKVDPPGDGAVTFLGGPLDDTPIGTSEVLEGGVSAAGVVTRGRCPSVVVNTCVFGFPVAVSSRVTVKMMTVEGLISPVGVVPGKTGVAWCRLEVGKMEDEGAKTSELSRKTVE